MVRLFLIGARWFLAGAATVLCLVSSETDVRSARLQPTDLEYRGAFRLPDESGGSSWEWSGGGLTYYPYGNPEGASDGFPGSLFGIGHDWDYQVSEVSIPVPVISSTKNLGELNTAVTLQPFADIRPNIENPGDGALRGGLEYLPKQIGQSSDKIHAVWGSHFQYETAPSHSWSELNLSNPQVAGPWYLGDHGNFSTNDYVMTIPTAWAGLYTPGYRLACGRFRDGGLGGKGPAVYAYGPWLQGDPPAPDTALDNVTLLEYGAVEEDGSAAMEGYSESDQWEGAVWVTAESSSAVLLVGTKGIGDSWYGYDDGTVYSDCVNEDPPCGGRENRGWWAAEARSRIIFFDTDQLAAVVLGNMESYEPQPYAYLDIDDVFYRTHALNEQNRVGAAAFDEVRGLIYVMEIRGDGDKSLVHVWKVNAAGAAPSLSPKDGIWKSSDGVVNLYIQKYATGSCAVVILTSGVYAAFLDGDYSDGILVQNDVLGRGGTLTLQLSSETQGTVTADVPDLGSLHVQVSLAFQDVE